MTQKPDETLVAVAQLFRELEQLRKDQAATQAQMIRACVTTMAIDPNTYRMRGHEGFADAKKIREQNQRDKASASLYLLSLATQLENYAGVYDPKASGNLIVSSTKGE